MIVAGGMNKDDDIVHRRIDSGKFYSLGDLGREVSDSSPMSEEWLTRRVSIQTKIRTLVQTSIIYLSDLKTFHWLLSSSLPQQFELVQCSPH